MGFGEVLIFAGNQTDPFPKILAALRFRAIVLFEAFGHVVGLADIDQWAQSVLGIGANQEVDTGAAAFGALNQLGELGARTGEGVAGPIHYFGGEGAVGATVNEE